MAANKNNDSNPTTSNQPVVVSDPRFRAGRTLVTSGQAENAVSIFATLLEHSISQFGASKIECAPAYYEYGNALLRAHEQAVPEQGEDPAVSDGKLVEEKKDAVKRNEMAVAAERRLRQKDSVPGSSSSPLTQATQLDAPAAKESGMSEVDNESSSVVEDSEETGDEDDIHLALEMIETSWSILDLAHTQESPYRTWIVEQVPRVLTGLGDVLSVLNRHADAADAYLRALQHRQAALEHFDQKELNSLLLQTSKDLTDTEQGEVLEYLKTRRLVVETNVLIAEALLAHEGGVDVVTSESRLELVKAADRVEYARGYYDASREELQETVVLMGQVKARLPSHELVEEEKENVCFVATLVMATGMTLAELDEKEDGNLQPPKAKRIKS